MTEEYIKQIIMEELIAVLEEEKKTDKERMKCNSPRRIRKGEAGHGKKKLKRLLTKKMIFKFTMMATLLMSVD